MVKGNHPVSWILNLEDGTSFRWEKASGDLYFTHDWKRTAIDHPLFTRKYTTLQEADDAITEYLTIVESRLARDVDQSVKESK
jgi:hypothetical protein